LYGGVFEGDDFRFGKEIGEHEGEIVGCDGALAADLIEEIVDRAGHVIAEPGFDGGGGDGVAAMSEVATAGVGEEAANGFEDGERFGGDGEDACAGVFEFGDFFAGSSGSGTDAIAGIAQDEEAGNGGGLPIGLNAFETADEWGAGLLIGDG